MAESSTSSEIYATPPPLLKSTEVETVADHARHELSPSIPYRQALASCQLPRRLQSAQPDSSAWTATSRHMCLGGQWVRLPAQAEFARHTPPEQWKPVAQSESDVHVVERQVVLFRQVTLPGQACVGPWTQLPAPSQTLCEIVPPEQVVAQVVPAGA